MDVDVREQPTGGSNHPYAVGFMCYHSPRMGQQHTIPGQSVATKRREAPPWVTAERPTLP